MSEEILTESIPCTLETPCGCVCFTDYKTIESNITREVKLTCSVNGCAHSQTLPHIEGKSFLFYDPENQNFYRIPFPADICAHWKFVKILD